MITKIRFQWGLHCSPNESPAYYHFQIIQDIKLNPRQIWCSYLFASKIIISWTPTRASFSVYLQTILLKRSETATEYTDWRYGSRGARFHDKRSWELAIWLNWSKTDVPQHLPWLFHDFPETEWWDIELQLVKNRTRFLKRSPKRFKN